MQLTCFKFIFKFIDKHLGVIKNVKKLKLEGDWAELDQKFTCSDNPRQNIWNKME